MKKRNGMMAAGAFAILFTGFPHIWSIYQPYVLSETGWSESMVSICFYLPTLFFVVGNIFGGRIYDKGYGRITLGIGGSVFAGGIILSALTLGIHPMITYMMLGVMQGIGQGMIYAVVLATAQKWFPHKTGFASGVVITANGLCGFILSPISKLLLERGGVRMALISVGFLVCQTARGRKYRNKRKSDICRTTIYISSDDQNKEVLLSCSHDDVWSDAVLSGVTDFTDDSD